MVSNDILSQHVSYFIQFLGSYLKVFTVRQVNLLENEVGPRLKDLI